MLDKRSPVTWEQCGTGNMHTERSVEPGAGALQRNNVVIGEREVGTLAGGGKELASDTMLVSHPHRHESGTGA